MVHRAPIVTGRAASTTMNSVLVGDEGGRKCTDAAAHGACDEARRHRITCSFRYRPPRCLGSLPAPLIPNLIDQNLYAQSRKPMDMILQGWSMSLFQASQQWSTRSS